MTLSALPLSNEAFWPSSEGSRFSALSPPVASPAEKNNALGNICDTLTLTSRVSEQFSEQTQSFLTQLQQLLSRTTLPPDIRFTLTIGPGDKIVASGPYKDEIERLLAQNPELAKLFRAIIALQVLLELQKTNTRFQDEFDDARTEMERDTARQRYHDAMASIRQNGASMSFCNGLIAMISLRNHNKEREFS